MLKFNNKKFKILQISDLQDTRKTSVDTLHFLINSIETIKPDLIIITGDQLENAYPWGKNERLKKNVSLALHSLLDPIDSMNIPFLVTFGNHDDFIKLSKLEQAKIYKEFKNCISFLDLSKKDIGTSSTLVYSTSLDKKLLNIFVVDSNNHQGSWGGYDNVHKDQLEWLINENEKIKDENDGNYVPSILFQHIPIPEIYDILEKVNKRQKGSVPGYRILKKNRYILKEEQKKAGDILKESPCIPDINSGEFETIKNMKNVFGIYFGHDHRNSFKGSLDGIDLGYCPGSGYNTYGLKYRGMRIFEFNEDDVLNYKTHVVYQNQFVKTKLYKPMWNFIHVHQPTSVDSAFPFAFKMLFLLILLLAIIIPLLILVKESRWVVLGILTFGLVYFLITFIICRIKNKKERDRILSKYKKD